MALDKKLFRNGPYADLFSQGVLVGNTLHMAGQVGTDASGKAPASLVEQMKNAYQHVESVLKEFARRDRQISEEARDRLDREGLSRSMLGRVMSQVAKERSFPSRDNRLPYLVDQMMTMLFHSNNVDDIFAEDHILRRKITSVLKRNSGMEDELDKEVRAKIKNLEEGTASFDVEYAKVMEQIKSKRRMD